MSGIATHSGYMGHRPAEAAEPFVTGAARRAAAPPNHPRQPPALPPLRSSMTPTFPSDATALVPRHPDTAAQPPLPSPQAHTPFHPRPASSGSSGKINVKDSRGLAPWQGEMRDPSMAARIAQRRLIASQTRKAGPWGTRGVQDDW